MTSLSCDNPRTGGRSRRAPVLADQLSSEADRVDGYLNFSHLSGPVFSAARCPSCSARTAREIEVPRGSALLRHRPGSGAARRAGLPHARRRARRRRGAGRRRRVDRAGRAGRGAGQLDELRWEQGIEPARGPRWLQGEILDEADFASFYAAVMSEDAVIEFASTAARRRGGARRRPRRPAVQAWLRRASGIGIEPRRLVRHDRRGLPGRPGRGAGAVGAVPAGAGAPTPRDLPRRGPALGADRRSPASTRTRCGGTRPARCLGRRAGADQRLRHFAGLRGQVHVVTA